MALNEISAKQTQLVNQKDNFKDVPAPGWLESKTADRNNSKTNPKGKGKDMGFDR